MFSSLKTEFATRLSITDSQQLSVLGDFLDSLDLELLAKGVEFSNKTTTETITLSAENNEYLTFFDFKWLQKSPAPVVKLKARNSSDEKVLTEGIDFDYLNSIFLPKPICAINFITETIYGSRLLEITGLFKFGVTLPVDLKLAGLGLASEFMAQHNLNVASQSGYSKSSVSIDKVSYGLKAVQTRSKSNAQSNWKKVLSKYGL